MIYQLSQLSFGLRDDRAVFGAMALQPFGFDPRRVVPLPISQEVM